MRRRAFVALAAAALGVAPLGAGAQTGGKAPVVGFLAIADQPNHVADLAGFRQGLREVGLVEGRTIIVEERYADGNIERVPSLIADLQRRGAAVIVVPGQAAALAVRRQAPQLPVVAVGLPSTVTDPDLFASLSRPGGSVTGFSHFGEDLAAKRIELLKEAVPGLTKVAILHNSVDPLFREWGEKTEEAARQQGLNTMRLGLATPSEAELATLMQAARGAGAQGLVVVRDFLTHVLREEIVRAAAAARMATMSEQRDQVEAGGLLSYGASMPDLFRRAAAYVDEILKGGKPATMPIQLATKFELVVNLKTAKALGIEIPPSILARADEVIE